MTHHLTRLQRRLLVVVLCAPLMGLLGVIAAEAVPDDRIADHLLDGQQAGILTREVGRPKTPLDTLASAPTECLGFSVGLGDAAEPNHVTTAIVAPTYFESPAYRPCEALDRNLQVYRATGELPPGISYLRYWHGYTVFTRPALAVFGVAGTRWIAFALVAVAVGAMVVVVGRALGFATAAILVAPTILTTDTLIGGFSATAAIGSAAAWFGGWLTFTFVSRHPDWRSAALVAALAGTLSAYLDLMTSMPGAYALTVVGAALGVIAASGVFALRGNWRVVGAAAIGWIVGLIWMWGSKWIIAAVTVGVDEVVDSVRSRVDLYVQGGRQADTSRVHGLSDNLGTWWDRPLTPWIVFGILAVLVVAAARGRRRTGILTTCAACAAIVAVPALGWYLGLSTHSEIHAFLVYRSLPMVFGAVAALLYVALTGSEERSSGVSGGESAEEYATSLLVEPEGAQRTSVAAGAPTR